MKKLFAIAMLVGFSFFVVNAQTATPATTTQPPAKKEMTSKGKTTKSKKAPGTKSATTKKTGKKGKNASEKMDSAAPAK